MEILVRKAETADLEIILEIYNHAIIHTTSVYSYQPHTLEMRTVWFREKTEHNYPVFVAETEGRVAGFASYGPFRMWPAYKYAMEHGVYVHTDFRQKGIAKKLMQQLIESARENEVHTLIAGIDSSNEASIRLHEQLGFEEAAHLKEVGYKFDKWLDLKLLQLILDTPHFPNEN